MNTKSSASLRADGFEGELSLENGPAMTPRVGCRIEKNAGRRDCKVATTWTMISLPLSIGKQCINLRRQHGRGLLERPKQEPQNELEMQQQ